MSLTREEVDELALRYLDGDLGDQAAKFEEAMKEEAARGLLVQSIVLSGQLLKTVKVDVATRKRMKRVRMVRRVPWFSMFAAAVAAAVLVVAVFRFMESGTGAESIASVVEASGEVRLVKVDGVKVDGQGMKVRVGESVVTGEGARAVIRYGDGTMMTLGGGTDVRLGGNAMLKQAFVGGGTVRVAVAVQGPGASLVAETPEARTEALGTEFKLTVVPGNTRLEVQSGRVKLTRTADGEAIIVSTGQYAAVAKGLILQAIPAGVAVVSNVKVVSDKIEDVSSIEAWKKSFIKDGMSDKEKALAIWESVVKFRHQDNPPNEFLHQETNVHDVIKTFNVYGYGMCCCASSNVEQLARAAGLRARGRIITGHSVPEVFYGNKWHYIDGSMICYFLDQSGDLVGVDDLIAATVKWYQENPGYKGNEQKLVEFMRQGGWKKGPQVYATTNFLDENGWLPAATHGWYSLMHDFDGANDGVYEYGYSQGYRVNIQLREGEVLTRNWSNKGLHVNMDQGGPPGSLKTRVGQDDLRYAPKYGDIAPGRVGNGTLVYDVPLAAGGVKGAALRFENLACSGDDGKSPALHVQKADAPGVLEFRMPSSYVYLSGQVSGNAVVGKGGSVKVSISRNQGLDWKEIYSNTTEGKSAIKVDIKPFVYRLYDYRLRVDVGGEGTGLDSLRVEHDIQHSQRALPALAAGENIITFSAGPQEGTITVEPCVAKNVKGGQLTAQDFRVQWDAGVNNIDPGLFLKTWGQGGTITAPISTPGEMVRVRFGAHYRARDARDGWDYQVSFDKGATWRTVGKAAGPAAGSCEYVVTEDVPKGTREALVRFVGMPLRNTTGIFNLRVDADYKEPAGGFRPVKITYVWEENGVEKRDVHIASKPEETYKIKCAVKPLMKSIILELVR